MTNEKHYIGLDVHKKSIQFCAKTADGTIVEEGRIAATRQALQQWVAKRPRPWNAAMEATMFSAWIYDELKPHAAQLKMAHPAMLKAISAAKHSSDPLDARKISDLVRMDWIPGVWVAPPEIRELRLHLRFRNLVVRQSTQVKNRISSTLMENGVVYSKEKLHQKKYFHELLEVLDEVPESVRQLLRRSRGTLDLFQSTQRTLLEQLSRDRRLAARVALLQTIPSVGVVTALTWALEIGDPWRFSSVDHAVSYCGLVSARQQSGEKEYRQPLSKKRNGNLQTILIEAAHLAPRYSPLLRQLYDKVKQEEHAGAAALAVARKLVAYLLAVDKSKKPFQVREPSTAQSSPTGKSASPSAPPVEGSAVAQRSSPSRVRVAAPKAGAPLTSAGRCAQSGVATGGSDGKVRRYKQIPKPA